MWTPRSLIAIVWLGFSLHAVRADETPLPQEWDYAPAMAKVAARFNGTPGVVLHIGDSITYSSPYGQWARGGAGQTANDKAVLKWMRAGAHDDTDGWHLARFDHPDGGRSHTACSGIRADEILAGGKRNMPPLAEILRRYRPQVVVLMLGTNDANAKRPAGAFRADMEKATSLILSRDAICVLSTIPPHPGQPELARAYNEALRRLARELSLPLIDYEREILKRRPDNWNGTLLARGDVHPTASQGGATAVSAPTAENLANSGYLLRGWLSVRKIAEVKTRVIDKMAVRQTEKPVPPENLVTLPVTRDTWLSNVGAEADGGNGGAHRLKLKSIQEMTLIDIDAGPLKGRVIESATLHVRHAAGPPLRRVTVGSVGAEWFEGTATGYARQEGASSFRRRKHPDTFWTLPESDLCSVILGQGGTTWRMAEALPPDDNGWQKVAVDPAIVAARVAGISHGFLLFDDTGSEWQRAGEQFTQQRFPNRFIHSRESGKANAPYLTVKVSAKDSAPPAAPGALLGESGDLPAGEAWVSWQTPKDEGVAGTIGFMVDVNGVSLPRYLIPLAGKAGDRVRMRLRDLKLAPGAEATVIVRAIDAAGNIGKGAEGRVQVSSRVPAALPGEAPVPFTDPAALPKLGDTEVAIIDELDKIHPVTGVMIPRQKETHLAANHLWSAREKTVRLHAARNEFVGFQIVTRGAPVAKLEPALEFEARTGSPRASFGRLHLVDSRNGPLPDPIVPLTSPAAAAVEGQKYGCHHCEVFVPHDAAAGEHRGTLKLRTGGQSLEIQVILKVWDFTLPDHLSFLPEMNCYALPANERDYYRLAHLHRTVLNQVPYSQSGLVRDGCAPGWNGVKLDWSGWDKRFGAYFDGSAFNDLPRRAVPIECFYLPLHENWPTRIEPNYNGDYWADRAFTSNYRTAFVEASRQMAEHVHQKGWNDTFFQFFLNGKNDFKTKGWSRGSSPWLLDEPANHQDYWALRYFGAAFHEGVAKAPGRGKLVFRADISRPQWQRDSLDGLLDYAVVGGAMRTYPRIVFDRKEAEGQVVIEYAGTNKIEEANVQPAGWCVDAWARGADGVEPWQTVGNADSWRKADELSLFYPAAPASGGTGPVPSIRLKSYRRGQQDVEYLALLGRLSGEPRWATGQRVLMQLRQNGEKQASGFTGGEDAGIISFSKLLPQELWALRVRVATAISAARPAAERRLIELRTPPRDPARLPDRHVSGGIAR